MIDGVRYSCRVSNLETKVRLGETPSQLHFQRCHVRALVTWQGPRQSGGRRLSSVFTVVFRVRERLKMSGQYRGHGTIHGGGVSDIPVSDVHLRNKVCSSDDAIDIIPSTFSQHQEQCHIVQIRYSVIVNAR